jgi:hypothetical protein
MTYPVTKYAYGDPNNYSAPYHRVSFHSLNTYLIFLPIIERNEEIVKVKTKKKKHNLCAGYASFLAG